MNLFIEMGPLMSESQVKESQSRAAPPIFVEEGVGARQILFVSTMPVICYYNGNLLRTETYVKYVGNKAIIVPLDVPIDYTFEQLGDMIYSMTTIDKQMFKLVLNCKYLLKSGNRFQHFPIWDDSSVY